MHSTLSIGGQALNGGDVAPDQYEAPKGFSLSLQMKNEADAERIYRELAEDGRVIVPLQQTFWALRYAHFIDRFGIPWMINCEA